MDQRIAQACFRGDCGQMPHLLSQATLSHEELNSALALAAEAGHADVVAILLHRGADPNCCNSNALLRACVYDRHAVVALLLSWGADPNMAGQLPLRAAAQYASPHSLGVVQMLLKYGANARAHKSLALQWASMNNNLELFDLLYPLSEPLLALHDMQQRGATSQDMHLLGRRMAGEALRGELWRVVGGDNTLERGEKRL